MYFYIDQKKVKVKNNKTIDCTIHLHFLSLYPSRGDKTGHITRLKFFKL